MKRILITILVAVALVPLARQAQPLQRAEARPAPQGQAATIRWMVLPLGLTPSFLSPIQVSGRR